MLVRHTFPLDAEYELQIGPGRWRPARRPPSPARAPDDSTSRSTAQRVDGAGHAARLRLTITAGPHTIAVAVVDRSARRRASTVSIDFADARRRASRRSPSPARSMRPAPATRRAAGGSSSARRRLPPTRQPCARRSSTRWRRAPIAGRCRRPAPRSTRCSSSIRRAARRDFETGIQQALARVLVDPRFLFRFEREPAQRRAGRAVSRQRPRAGVAAVVLPLEQHSRRRAARRRGDGRLQDPAVLEQQVRRMLADPRADALVSNFAGQWLYLRELQNAQTRFAGLRRQPAPGVPARDRAALPHASCARIAASSICSTPTTRSSTSGWRGTTASRTSTAATSAASAAGRQPAPRLLGQGSILTVTSVATRTSPVSRGKWVLENLLGAPPPQPPPGVETNLEKDPAQVKATSLRQRLEQHRANPACASCHKIMDPIGFALENFDHVGKWRDDGRRRPRSTRPASSSTARRSTARRPAAGAARRGRTCS